jgi:hypothetical protein
MKNSLFFFGVPRLLAGGVFLSLGLSFSALAAEFRDEPDVLPASLDGNGWSSGGQQTYSLLIDGKKDSFRYDWYWNYSGKFNLRSYRTFLTASGGSQKWSATSLNKSTFPRESNNSLELFGNLTGYLGIGEDDNLGPGFPEYGAKYPFMQGVLHRPVPFVVDIKKGVRALDFTGGFEVFRKSLRPDNVFYTGQLYYGTMSISEATYNKSRKFAELVLAAPAMIVSAQDGSWKWSSKLNVNRFDASELEVFSGPGGNMYCRIPRAAQTEHLDLSVPIPRGFSGKVDLIFTGFVARYTVTKFTTHEVYENVKFSTGKHPVYHRVEEGGLVMLPMSCVDGKVTSREEILVGSLGDSQTVVSGYKGRISTRFDLAFELK